LLVLFYVTLFFVFFIQWSNDLFLWIDLEVTCFGYDGIDAIKSALKAGEACETNDIPIKVGLKT